MPRPNVDLPNLIMGGAKDYASREDISRDEAYAELMAIGLAEVNIFDCIEEHRVSDTAEELMESDGDRKNNDSTKD